MSRSIHKPIDLHAPGAIEELIAFHHSVFGDARMEDEGGSDDKAGDGEGSQEESEEEGAEGAEGNEGEEDGAGDGDDDLPEAAKKKLTKANKEAARYRTQLREAEEKLANAKTPEEVQEIVAKMTADREAGELALLRENVALKAKLPPELAQRLQGATREELEKDAKALAKFAETDDDPDLSGGLDPSNDDDDSDLDPRKLAEQYGPRRRR